MEQLSEFEYERELGSGEFGTVYLCRSRLTDERRAVKHIRLPQQASLDDWRREAEALAACSNDHVVRIHHAAATGEGPVLVMDYLQGGDASSRWVPKGGPVGDVVSCLLDATWGLQHLHNEGLLHRDLKPANLLFNEAGRTVIGDFGLAGQANVLTPQGYMPHVPPEVMGGAAWTRAADLYALGVTGWRLLGAPARPDSPAEVVDAVRSGTWPNRNIWLPHVHSRLKTALRAAMHPDPGSRPESAQQLREALLRAVPNVSWSAASATSWVGTDGKATYAMGVTGTGNGWQVDTTRALKAGPRRLGAMQKATTEIAAMKTASKLLDLLAARGVAGLSTTGS